MRPWWEKLLALVVLTACVLFIGGFVFGLSNRQTDFATGRAANASAQSLTLSGLHLPERTDVGNNPKQMLLNKELIVVGKEMIRTQYERPLYVRYILETPDGERCSVGAYSQQDHLHFNHELDTIVVGDHVTVEFPYNLTIASFVRKKKK